MILSRRYIVKQRYDIERYDDNVMTNTGGSFCKFAYLSPMIPCLLIKSKERSASSISTRSLSYYREYDSSREFIIVTKHRCADAADENVVRANALSCRFKLEHLP